MWPVSILNVYTENEWTCPRTALHCFNSKPAVKNLLVILHLNADKPISGQSKAIQNATPGITLTVSSSSFALSSSSLVLKGFETFSFSFLFLFFLLVSKAVMAEKYPTILLSAVRHSSSCFLLANISQALLHSALTAHACYFLDICDTINPLRAFLIKTLLIRELTPTMSNKTLCKIRRKRKNIFKNG